MPSLAASDGCPLGETVRDPTDPLVDAVVLHAGPLASRPSSLLLSKARASLTSSGSPWQPNVVFCPKDGESPLDLGGCRV